MNSFEFAGSSTPKYQVIHLLLLTTRKYSIINANLKLIDAKYIHIIQSAFTSVDTQPFASKGLLLRQQTTINTILLHIRDNEISIW